MTDITVKILKGQVEIASVLISSPATAGETKSHLTNTTAKWRGKLTEVNSGTGIVGQRLLTPGETYHLHLQRHGDRAGKQMGGFTGRDPSTKIASRLVSDGPLELPALDELRDLLEKPLPAQLPLAEAAMRLLRRSADGFILDRGGSSLSIAVSAAVGTPVQAGGEPFTAFHVDGVLINTLMALDEALPLNKRLGLHLQRDGADSPLQMTVRSASGHSLRPDLMLRDASTGRLLFKGEEKGVEHDLTDAIADLTDKTVRWSEYYYGGLDYLPSYAAAGSFMQFFALQRGNPVTAVEISPPYNLADPDDRATVVLAAINLHTLLAVLRRSLPRYVLPVGKELSFTDPEGFTRTLYFRPDQPHVIKRIMPWDTFSEAFHLQQKWLKDVYKRTARHAGLVHAVREPKFSPAYQVELEPLGLRSGDAAVTSEAELRHAAHGLLHGLDALHSVGYVHRDMRWANTACDVSKQHYFLLDLELAAPADLEPNFHLRSWTPDTLVGSLYRTASDLYMLGQMLQERAHAATTTAAMDFINFLERPAEQLARGHVTAASLLQHEWLRCAGQHCRQAGAQPNTRR